MFQRPRQSSPVPESSPPAEAAGQTSQMLLQWRDDAKRVGRAYTAWCAADGRDRDRLYASFLDALTREQRAAHQLERLTSALRSADPVA